MDILYHRKKRITIQLNYNILNLFAMAKIPVFHTEKAESALFHRLGFCYRFFQFSTGSKILLSSVFSGTEGRHGYCSCL